MLTIVSKTYSRVCGKLPPPSPTPLSNPTAVQVRLWEDGWKDRYYQDKCKLEDIEGGGGRERLFQSYVEGLCWVMLYYYQGCPSWTWYYPFHYAPFASDLLNCDR